MPLPGSWVRYLTLLITVMGIVVLGLSLTEFFKFVNSSSSPSAATTTAQPGTQMKFDVSTILDANLFGISRTALPSAQLESMDAPETLLKLELKGVFIGKKEEQSAAFVLAQGNEEDKSYNIGDRLPGNAELIAIYPDRILLKRNGKIETLRLNILWGNRNTNNSGNK